MNAIKNSLERRLLLSIAMVTFLYSLSSAFVVFHFSYQNEFSQLHSQQQQLAMALQPAAALAVFKENKNNITVAFERKKIEQSALKVALFAATLALGEAILLALAIIVVTRIVLLQPLSKLANSVSNLNAGQSHRLDIAERNHQDEIGLIGKSINKMIASIDDAMRQITREKNIALQTTASKSRFLAAASHDLRQPMHALNMYLGLLQSYSLSPEALTLLAKARQCGQSMDEMFLAFLDISKLDAAVVKPNLSNFALQEIIDQVLLEFHPVARDKGITLSCVRTKSWIYSDADFVKNILRNLMSNALRYTATGKVVVGCRHKNGTVALCVADTGCGIADIHKNQIFNDFYQINAADKPHNKEQGIGLGLAITQRLATLLATRIEVVSQLGRGSIFSVCLPAASPLARPLRCEPLSMRLEKPTSLTGLLVLVIDDDEIILDSTYSLLSTSGFFTIAATSAAEGIARLTAENRIPDLILCDYQLAFATTGYDAIEMIREEFATNIPALIVTGDTTPEHLREWKLSDIRVLHKPMQAERLLKEIINTIKRYRMDRPGQT